LIISVSIILRKDLKIQENQSEDFTGYIFYLVKTILKSNSYKNLISLQLKDIKNN